jgi:hypothetical protein
MAAFVQTLIFLNYLLGYLFVNHSSHKSNIFFFRIFGKTGSTSNMSVISFDELITLSKFSPLYVKKFDFCYLIKICKNQNGHRFFLGKLQIDSNMHPLHFVTFPL